MLLQHADAIHASTTVNSQLDALLACDSRSVAVDSLTRPRFAAVVERSAAAAARVASVTILPRESLVP